MDTESQLEQMKYVDTTSPEVTVSSEPAPLAMLPPATEANEKWQQIGEKISVFLAKLPDYIGRFFSDYKQPLISIGLIVATIITVRVVLAILNALNGVPLLAPTLELIGIGYSVWFVNRYLLKMENRQELSTQIESLKRQLVGI